MFPVEEPISNSTRQKDNRSMSRYLYTDFEVYVSPTLPMCIETTDKKVELRVDMR